MFPFPPWKLMNFLMVICEEITVNVQQCFEKEKWWKQKIFFNINLAWRIYGYSFHWLAVVHFFNVFIGKIKKFIHAIKSKKFLVSGEKFPYKLSLPFGIRSMVVVHLRGSLCSLWIKRLWMIPIWWVRTEKNQFIPSHWSRKTMRKLQSLIGFE